LIEIRCLGIEELNKLRDIDLVSACGRDGEEEAEASSSVDEAANFAEPM